MPSVKLQGMNRKNSYPSMKQIKGLSFTHSNHLDSIFENNHHFEQDLPENGLDEQEKKTDHSVGGYSIPEQIIGGHIPPLNDPHQNRSSLHD